MSKAALMETNEHEQEITTVQRVTAGPARLIEFLKETRAELRKVVTPTLSEVQATTIVVLVTVFMFAAYFELVDLVFGRGLDEILKHLVSH
jgi:preprotein translocase subunit SecE